MAFDSILAGEDILAENVQQILDALTGVSGGGQRFQFTQLNDSSNYAVTIRNLDTTNGYGLKVTDAADSNLLLVYKNSVVLGASAANDTLTINCNIAGKVYIGDSANTGMTVGLTINQAGNDNEILAFKSSDVAHGITDYTETDTFGFIQKDVAASGGVQLVGLTAATIGLDMRGYGVTDNTTKTTAGRGYVEIDAWKKSGTGLAAPGTDANLLVVRSAGTTRFLFDAEGSFHADVESTTFDEHDDIALLEAMDTEFKRRQGQEIGHEFGQWLAEHKETLRREKVVSFYDPDGPRVMVNFTKLAMLHTGALRQLGQKLALVEQRLAALPAGN